MFPFSFSVKHQDYWTHWKLSSSIKYQFYFYLNEVLLCFILSAILLTDPLLKTKLTLLFSYPSFFLLLNKDAERQHREVVSIYRTHLLSAAQVRFFLLEEELLLLNCPSVIWCSLCLWCWCLSRDSAVLVCDSISLLIEPVLEKRLSHV